MAVHICQNKISTLLIAAGFLKQEIIYNVLFLVMNHGVHQNV